MPIIYISNITDLQFIGIDPALPLNGDYELTHDIDASATVFWNAGEGFAPVGPYGFAPFTGTFDGKGFCISDLTINRPLEDYVGLFSATDGATIRNIKLLRCSVVGRYEVGALIADAINMPLLDNCHVSGSVSASDDDVGGMLGYCDTVTLVSNCSSSVTVVSSGDDTGCLIGYSADTAISSCTSSGSVSGGSFATGGLIGCADTGSVISSCSSSGPVLAPAQNAVGGLVGYVKRDVSISSCFSSCSVSSSIYVGGLIGYCDGVNTSAISKCFCTGPVSGVHYIGGFIGCGLVVAKILIDDCYATGSVSGSGDYVGGFIGYSKTTLTNVYSIGPVTGPNAKGLIGKNIGSLVTSCYWDTDTSLCPVSDGGSGKSTVLMKQQTTFAGWDFLSPVWYIEETLIYPQFFPFSLPPPRVSLFSSIEGASRNCLPVSISLLWYIYRIVSYKSFLLVPNGTLGIRALGFDGTNFTIIASTLEHSYFAAVAGNYIFSATSGFLRCYSFSGSAWVVLGSIAVANVYTGRCSSDGTFVYRTNWTSGLDAFSWDGVNFALLANSGSGASRSKHVACSPSFVFEGTQTAGLLAYSFSGVMLSLLDSYLPVGSGDIFDIVAVSDSDIFFVSGDGTVHRVSFDGTSFAFVAQISSPVAGFAASSIGISGTTLLVEYNNPAHTDTLVSEYDISPSIPLLINPDVFYVSDFSTDEMLSYVSGYGFVGRSFTLYAFTPGRGPGGLELVSGMENEVSAESPIIMP